jgi:hypothetical protein
LRWSDAIVERSTESTTGRKPISINSTLSANPFADGVLYRGEA